MTPRRIVDLSHPLDEGTTVYPGDPEVAVAPATTIERDGFNVLAVHIGSQSGTHVDAPYHFVADGARVDEVPLERFLAPAVVADVRHVEARQAIAWADLEPVADRLDAGRMLLLHTGWSRHWHGDGYFDHPFLAVEAARRLVAAGVRTVGIDALSIDETMLDGPQPTGFATHHVLLGAGAVVVENLTNLAAIDWPDPLVSVLPLRLTGADGAPVRAVAIELAHGDGAIALSSS